MQVRGNFRDRAKIARSADFSPNFRTKVAESLMRSRSLVQPFSAFKSFFSVEAAGIERREIGLALARL
jgi:hypothetical protein